MFHRITDAAGATTGLLSASATLGIANDTLMLCYRRDFLSIQFALLLATISVTVPAIFYRLVT
jgi:hypothetical protein